VREVTAISLHTAPTLRVMFAEGCLVEVVQLLAPPLRLALHDGLLVVLVGLGCGFRLTLHSLFVFFLLKLLKANAK